MDSLLNVLFGNFFVSFLVIVFAVLLYLLFLILVVTIICSIVSKYVVSATKEIMNHKARLQNITVIEEDNNDNANQDDDYLDYE